MTSIGEILLPFQVSFVKSRARRKLFLSSRQIGKSFVMAFIAVKQALEASELNHSGLSLCISTGMRASNEFLTKVRQFAEAVHLLRPDITYQASRDSVRFSNGARVVSLPSGNPSALRGYSLNGGALILDEFAFVERPEEVWNAIVPTMTRSPTSTVCVASTPAGKNSLFYELYRDWQQDPDAYVQTTTLEDAVGMGLNVSLEEIKKLCPDEETYRMEYCCEFMDSYGSLIDTSLLEFIEPKDEKPKAIYAGYDVARSGDKSAIVSVKQLNDGSFLVSDIVVLSNMKYDQQIEMVKSIYKKEQWASAFVDSVGLGGPIAENLHDKVSARIKGFSWSESNKTPAYEYFRSLVFDHKLRFADHLKPQIIADFQNVSRMVSENGKVKFVASHSSQGHSDITSALVLALQAAKANPTSLSTPICRPFNSAFGNRTSFFK